MLKANGFSWHMRAGDVSLSFPIWPPGLFYSLYISYSSYSRKSSKWRLFITNDNHSKVFELLWKNLWNNSRSNACFTDIFLKNSDALSFMVILMKVCVNESLHIWLSENVYFALGLSWRTFWKKCLKYENVVKTAIFGGNLQFLGKNYQKIVLES